MAAGSATVCLGLFAERGKTLRRDAHKIETARGEGRGVSQPRYGIQQYGMVSYQNAAYLTARGGNVNGERAQ